MISFSRFSSLGSVKPAWVELRITVLLRKLSCPLEATLINKTQKKLNIAFRVQECDATEAEVYAEVWPIKKTKITYLP